MRSKETALRLMILEAVSIKKISDDAFYTANAALMVGGYQPTSGNPVPVELIEEYTDYIRFRNIQMAVSALHLTLIKESERQTFQFELRCGRCGKLAKEGLSIGDYCDQTYERKFTDPSWKPATMICRGTVHQFIKENDSRTDQESRTTTDDTSASANET